MPTSNHCARSSIHLWWPTTLGQSFAKPFEGQFGLRSYHAQERRSVHFRWWTIFIKIVSTSRDGTEETKPMLLTLGLSCTVQRLLKGILHIWALCMAVNEEREGVYILAHPRKSRYSWIWLSLSISFAEKRCLVCQSVPDLKCWSMKMGWSVLSFLQLPPGQAMQSILSRAWST